MPSTDKSGSSPEGLRPTEEFTVTPIQLLSQLTLGAATDSSGEHWVWLDDTMQIITTDGPRPADEVAWFIAHKVWPKRTYTLCSEPHCIAPDHLTIDQAEATKAEDDRMAALVQQTTTTLAALYRKGKARGLLKPASNYGG